MRVAVLSALRGKGKIVQTVQYRKDGVLSKVRCILLTLITLVKLMLLPNSIIQIAMTIKRSFLSS
jgi:hypothetical protein